MRYKLLRNGKRQILNVLLPGDLVGIPGSFLKRAVYSVTAITDLTMNVCALDSCVQLYYRRPRPRGEKLIARSERRVEFVDASAMQALAHYQPQNLTPVPTPATV